MLAYRTSPAKVSMSATLLLRLAPDTPASACPALELERRDLVESVDVVRDNVSILRTPVLSARERVSVCEDLEKGLTSEESRENDGTCATSLIMYSLKVEV